MKPYLTNILGRKKKPPHWWQDVLVSTQLPHQKQIAYLYHLFVFSCMATGSSPSEGNGPGRWWTDLSGRGFEKSRNIFEQRSDRLRQTAAYIARWTVAMFPLTGCDIGCHLKIMEILIATSQSLPLIDHRIIQATVVIGAISTNTLNDDSVEVGLCYSSD